MTASPTKPRSTGFTLLELSISLLIIGLLSSGLLVGLAAQRDQADNQNARQQLEEIRETLLGYALSNGRLPCPARATLASNHENAGKEDCSLQHGVLPWATLALPETDPWGQRFTYYASTVFTGAIPTGGNASFSLDSIGNANIYDSNGKRLASDLPTVILSHGQHAAGAYNADGKQLAGASGEEKENADADLTFIQHNPTPDFDDQVTWIIPSLLKSRMVSAGKLP